MGAAIAITSLDRSAMELRQLAAANKDAQVVRRLLALALVLEGKSRTEAAQQSWHGTSDSARLGASLQCQRRGGPDVRGRPHLLRTDNDRGAIPLTVNAR